jgi:hypothetical protein
MPKRLLFMEVTERTERVEGSGRYELDGKPKELYKAVVLAHKFMPKGFVSVSAGKFLKNPKKYGLEGVWVEKEIES